MSSTVNTVSDQDDSACIKWHTLGVLSNQIPGPKSKKRRSRKWNKVDDELLKKMVEKEIEIEGMDINTFQFGRVKHSFWTNISNGVNENKIDLATNSIKQTNQLPSTHQNSLSAGFTGGQYIHPGGLFNRNWKGLITDQIIDQNSGKSFGTISSVQIKYRL